ncbi:hypothetical protein WJX72_002879 [[Myrmecia] bisecta]|uniref:Amine oxidase domain-containing protein n=1 Tax=[Myrmecia] bisecta TaxID=41462 RepID=A0AAW1PSD3_9CHLO
MAERLYVGVPSMAAVAEFLSTSAGITGAWGHKVTRVMHNTGTGNWEVESSKQHPPNSALGSTATSSQTSDSGYDAVVLADFSTIRPGPNTVQFEEQAAEGEAPQQDPEWLSRMRTLLLDNVQIAPTFSLMLALPQTLGLHFDAASVIHSRTIQWLACDSSKPGRQRDDGLECWVATTTPAYSADLLAMSKQPGCSPDAMAALVHNELRHVLAHHLSEQAAAALSSPVFLRVQRWGAAFKRRVINTPSLLNKEVMLGACGDFCAGSDPGKADAVSAISSGLDAADKVASAFLAQVQSEKPGS